MKKMTSERWLYIFVLLNPVFDLLSSLFTNLGFSFTPSTIIRPLLPFSLIIYLFIIDKKIRKKLLIISFVYISYIGIHLYLYKNIITGISYGSIINEAQYLMNYTYLIFSLLLFIYVFYNKKNKLEDTVFYNTSFYIGSIYLAIITQTSLPSYIEGTGYRGWFNTSGAVGAILITSLFIILPYLAKKNFKFINKFLFVFFTLFYLCFLIGSRVGFLGSIIVIISFILASIGYYLSYNYKAKIKKYFPHIIGGMLVLIASFALFGSYTLTRRKQLEDLTDKKVHIAYDLLDIKESMDNKTITEGYMNDNQKKALESLYDYANEIKLPNVDLRSQQLIYHHYLYKYQHSISLKLFGNGYLANYGSLTLEMEGIALWFNFGVIGFILYAMPFLCIFIYGLYIGIKHVKLIDIEYFMYMAGIFTSYIISTLAGRVYFNTSVMPVIIIIHVLLLNKIAKMKGNN